MSSRSVLGHEELKVIAAFREKRLRWSHRRVSIQASEESAEKGGKAARMFHSEENQMQRPAQYWSASEKAVLNLRSPRMPGNRRRTDCTAPDYWTHSSLESQFKIPHDKRMSHLIPEVLVLIDFLSFQRRQMYSQGLPATGSDSWEVP